MRRGITLYEVVIALVIFSGSVAAISEAVSTGMRAAVQSRLQSQAILLAQSKMQEVIAGVVPRQSVAQSAFTEPQLEGLELGPERQAGAAHGTHARGS